MTGMVLAVTAATALGCALVGGVFFAFSTFVMRGLKQLPAATGITTMQSINRAAVTVPFMLALFGTAALSLGSTVWAIHRWADPPAPWVFAGSLTYLVSAILITIAGNVPLNDALARLQPLSPPAGRQWSTFLTRWTRWNHLRGAGSLAAAALLVGALVQQ